MNVGQANQKPLNTIEYLSLGLMRKTLTSHSDNSVVQAVRAEAIRNLKDFQCLICQDVQEKILQTRCCDAILCAACYLSIQQPAKCPGDSAPFCGEMVRDLKLASRQVNSQIDLLLSHFADIPAKPLIKDLGKCRAQSNTILRLNRAGLVRHWFTLQLHLTSFRALLITTRAGLLKYVSVMGRPSVALSKGIILLSRMAV